MPTERFIARPWESREADQVAALENEVRQLREHVSALDAQVRRLARTAGPRDDFEAALALAIAAGGGGRATPGVP